MRKVRLWLSRKSLTSVPEGIFHQNCSKNIPSLCQQGEVPDKVIEALGMDLRRRFQPPDLLSSTAYMSLLKREADFVDIHASLKEGRERQSKRSIVKKVQSFAHEKIPKFNHATTNPILAWQPHHASNYVPLDELHLDISSSSSPENEALISRVSPSPLLKQIYYNKPTRSHNGFL